MSGPTIRIGEHVIGDEHPVFVMAEAGANHNGELSLAKELIDAAVDAGADCIKFQTFTAEEFCADKTKTFTYQSQGRQVTESEFEMFQRLEFTRDEWSQIMAYCAGRGIQFLTTVQDPVNLQMMLGLGLMGIKVGSDDFDHVVNLRQYAQTGLPLIISKGMADLAEVDRVLADIVPAASGGLAVLHCVSIYPSQAHHLNLSQLTTLRARYPKVIWGFSDHTPSTLAPALAVALGARIIEKHFTLDHNLPGPDHWFSMDPKEFREMTDNIRFAEEAMGDGIVAPRSEEMVSRMIMRRRVLARHSLSAGSVLSEENVQFKRAENGAFAGDWGRMIGQRLRVAKNALDPIDIAEVEA